MMNLERSNGLVKSRCWYLPIIVLALLLRIGWAAAVPVQPVSDSAMYETFARFIAEGQGYASEPGNLTAYWPVGPSFVYSVCFRIMPDSYALTTAVHIVCGLMVVLFSMLLAERWFNRAAALVTGLLLACWPVLIQFTTILGSELMFAALLTASLWVWTCKERPWLARAIATGLLLGAASYVRPTALLLPVLYGLFMVISERSIVRAGAAVGVTVVIMAVCIAPWSMRNTQLFDQFVLISTNGGANMWMGNNPDSDGGYMPRPAERLGGMNEAEIDALLSQEAVQYIKDEPVAFITRTMSKLVRLHSHESIGVVWNEPAMRDRFGDSSIMPAKLVSNAYWLGALLLGLGGIVMLLIKRGFWATVFHPTVVVWGYFAGVHAVIVIQDRYHFQSIPLIAMLGAYVVVEVVARWRGCEGEGDHMNTAASSTATVSTPAT